MFKKLKNNERITEARKAAGLSQKQLASQTGFSSSTISAYEQGTRQPTQDNYTKLASTLDVPVLWLMGLDEGVEYTPQEQVVLNMLHEKKTIDIEELKSEDIELVIDGRKATAKEIAIISDLILSMRSHKN